MDTLSPLIDQERKAVALLRKKLLARERRLEVLESLAPADKFDIAIEAELTAPTVDPETVDPETVEKAVAALVATPGDSDRSHAASAHLERPRHKLDERYSAIMEFIGDDTKTAEQVTKFLIDSDHITRGEEVKVRRFMFELKGKYGLIASPRRGVYRRKNVETAERSV